ncbi:dTDP-4-amino-4,6-dideoxygalactose transaminase [Homoserinimonas aerilata]|uniref:dTDP-4-amino-4,6-dideoxygalactose transaminase n=1 Tax=Homoserinimonas aerilata TaxID=1162970 RepID=A0A542Y1Q4_9MICO|nr:DegT/DnrJ/EryC1/StrS family aminotransferase [Homoserinimonas aerilata]TQL42007.1 dTDP-4-amino-4,6-dideoxygalactose transaminase [Homoserinimonas aerilata]
MRVPFVDLVSQQAEIAAEVLPLWQQIFETAGFIGGDHVESFERDFASFTGVRHCVGVANGTDALELALRAVGVEPAGEVIIPVNTFIATAEAASRIGAVPVFVDVDPQQLLIDPDAVAAAVTSRTQAIIPVHLYGQVAPVGRLLPIAARHGLPIVEDNAQAQGASDASGRAGGLGTIAATSFYPGKNLGAAGDAGAVTTDDAGLAQIVRELGAHGSAVKYVHKRIGVNSRLDAIQAVVLSAKLKRLEGWNALRRAAADRYRELLADRDDVRAPLSRPGSLDVWHLYVVQVEERERMLTALGAAGVGAGIHYPTPLHLTEAYAGLGHRRGEFPVAEAAAGRLLSLPMFPHLSAEQQEYAVDSIPKGAANVEFYDEQIEVA